MNEKGDFEQLNLRISCDLKDRLKRIAELENRSMSAQVCILLQSVLSSRSELEDKSDEDIT